MFYKMVIHVIIYLYLREYVFFSTMGKAVVTRKFAKWVNDQCNVTRSKVESFDVNNFNVIFSGDT